MATIRRAGFGTVFNIENEKVGIGTTGKFFTEVRVLKNLELSDANVVTQAQLENYQGFLSNETRLSGNDVDLNKLVGYVRGEAYYGESHAHTQDDGTVVNMVGSAHTTFSHNVIDDSSNIQSGAMGDIIIDGEFTVSSGTTYCSSVDQLTSVANFTVPTGDTDDRIHCHTAGSMRFNEDLGTLEFYTGDEWKTVNSFKDTGNRGRGIFTGGEASGGIKAITFVNVSTQGNAVSFGELSVTGALNYAGGCSDGTRGLFGGGRNPDNTKRDVIQYITTASTGDTIDFGNLTNARRRCASTSSSTRGLWGSADGTPSTVNIIDYVEIQTLGNALDFGDMSSAAYSRGALSSPTRAVWFGGGDAFPTIRNMESVSIASKGNGVIFGDMTEGRSNAPDGGFSNGVRGVIAGGYGISPGYTLRVNIEQITIASEGNAVEFGTLSSKTRDAAGAQNIVRGLIAGGANPSTEINVISSISLTTSGSSEDFGDLSIATKGNCGLSDSHGGLGGF